MQLMNNQRLLPKLTRLTGFLILILSLSGTAFSGGIKNAYKLSPVVAKELEFIKAHPAYDYAIPVIVQVDKRFFATLRRHKVKGLVRMVSPTEMFS